ncbi:hypothetical protein JX266_009146 [Neoarthrinium moseri]|nr:hypothetical protein JX266_009146 [Neoarthrinium moseri]
MEPLVHCLLPFLVDQLAAADPKRVSSSVPQTKDPKDGFQDIPAETFARILNRCTWYLEGILGCGRGHPTLTYLRPQDVIYAILVLASIKSGYKMLLNSPHNTLEADISISTECGVLPSLFDPEDWKYLSYSPALGNKFREISGGLYEKFIVRKPEYDMYQGAFGAFPDLEEWPIKDLYRKHPTKDCLWLSQGRTDDIMVF